MRKILFMVLILLSVVTIAQDKKSFEKEFKVADIVAETVVENMQKQAKQAIFDVQKYYDISAEGTSYPKGTFPRKIDTTKVLIIYSTIDKVTGEDGNEFTSPRMLQKVMCVCNKPNSFTLMDYFDESMKPIIKDLIIWQTKEFPKTK
jgi:hypothetical protein